MRICNLNSMVVEGNKMEIMGCIFPFLIKRKHIFYCVQCRTHRFSETILLNLWNVISKTDLRIFMICHITFYFWKFTTKIENYWKYSLSYSLQSVLSSYLWRSPFYVCCRFGFKFLWFYTRNRDGYEKGIFFLLF